MSEVSGRKDHNTGLAGPKATSLLCVNVEVSVYHHERNFIEPIVLSFISHSHI